MQSMDQHLTNLIKEEKITAEAAYEKAINKKIFADMMAENSVRE